MSVATITPPAGATEVRLLRHHTKNALASILAQLSNGLSVTSASRRVAAELERRVMLTAQIADALFGLTRVPGPFGDRLLGLCEGVVGLLGESDQYLTLICRVDGDVALPMQEAVLRIAHEFVGNAIKHGMSMRLIGRIEVTVTSQVGGTVLEVSDDGWGWNCHCGPVPGEGMRVARALADAAGGQVSLERVGDRTVAQLLLPPAHLDA